MKKALIVATVGGFLSQFEMNDVRLLQQNGYEVHYASNLDNPMYPLDVEALKAQGVVLHQTAFSKNPAKLKQHFRVYRALKRLIEQEQIDLVHCHTPVGGVLARLAARFAHRDVFVIYTAHGFHFYTGAPLKNWLYYPIERLLARWTDRLITINREDYARAQTFHYKPHGCAVKIAGVGLNLRRFYPQSDRQAARETDVFRLITVGEVNRNKNLEVVLRALAKLRDPRIRYTFYGGGKSVDYILSVARECGLEEVVRYGGVCTHPEDVLQSAHMFVFPSVREGLGMAALEALACGIPVLALDNRGTREYMRDGVNGFVCKENSVDAFAEKISQAVSLYEKGLFLQTFPAEKVSDVSAFALCETEKIMKGVYADADRA